MVGGTDFVLQFEWLR